MDENQTYPTVAYQLSSVCVPVTVTPFAKAGQTVTKCCTKPTVIAGRYTCNGVKNERGTIAMARTMEPHSASAQFFINLVDNDFLNFSEPTINGWGYCVFGKVTDGMDVVDKIAKVKTKTVGIHENVPADLVMITGASRFE